MSTPNFKWLTIRQVAERFSVSYTTVAEGRHEFGKLRRAKIGGRTLILRSDVDKLDRALERSAQALTAEVVDLSEHRKTA